MSRSNPTDNSPNPSTRWYEWDGANGLVRYYDKAKGEVIAVPDGFTYLLLDETATIKGWNDPAESGIYSNEVRDTRQDTMLVKLFKGGTVIASGLYADIKDRVAAAGGHFTATNYIAFRTGEQLHIGAIQFKGAALGAWMEFKKANRAEIYKSAIQIKGFVEGKKGKVVFRTPVFHLKPIQEETEKLALELDKQLQTYLTGYFSRTKSAAAQPPAGPVPPTDDEPTMSEPPLPEPDGAPDIGDGVPF